MRFTSILCKALALFALFRSPAAFAQSPVEEIAELPVRLSTEQTQRLSQLSVDATPATAEIPARPHVRRHLRRPPQLLTPEEEKYKRAVEQFGVNQHRYVHCDLPHGKVRTGVITDIREDGFTLKDGIFAEHKIFYSDLKASPRPVAAVGTRIGQGLKWTGVVLGVIALLPLFPLALLVWDGC